MDYFENSEEGEIWRNAELAISEPCTATRINKEPLRESWRENATVFLTACTVLENKCGQLASPSTFQGKLDSVCQQLHNKQQQQ
ncbi:unnamed protein product [Dovyalis caffra]|uniref:Uncharacterized protein n=1 Tax=Dovyalis caffra TaxID=77055 RepID=A0AAV1SCG9_9ROSI|nr:unnamed protein product [Dovyalis caffra]